MITREGQKKLTNVAIITLKKFGKKFEMAVYPNKLYEYKNGQDTPLDEILHSFTIYKSVSTGDLASEQDLELFNLSKESIVKYILDNGYEQKAQATSNYELASIEKQIVSLIQGKVTYYGSYVSDENLLNYIKKVTTIKNLNPKKQVSKIIKELEKIGFERINYKVISELDTTDIDKIKNLIIAENNYLLEIVNNGFKMSNGYILVKSHFIPYLTKYANQEGIKYLILNSEEVEEEIIC